MLKPDTIETRHRTRGLPGIMLSLALLLVFTGSQAQSNYVKKYRRLADSLGATFGIPPAIILGVAILESGSGTSRNAKLLNNHFGIVGKNNLMKSKGIRSRYKQYSSVRLSYADFCRVLSRKKYYARLKGNMDHKLWIEAMANARYSEAPVEWKKRVNATIRKNKLSATH